MKQLPNILTLANLFCGAIAILLALHTPVFVSSYNGQTFLVSSPPPIYWASVFIGIAAVFDFIDGLAARLLQAQSPLGGELDSLSDVVSFGVAPAMILYQLLSQAYMQQPGAMEVSLLSVIPALLLPCFTAYRLARFNVDTEQTTYFKGVPAPAVGLMVASLPLLLFYEQMPVAGWLQHPWVLYLIIALLCFLMVSNLPFFSLKFKSLSWRKNALPYLLIVLTAISIPFIHWAAVPFCFFLYVVLALGKFWFAPE